MEKQIKYDFTKCNNLEFKANLDERPINGYLKITEANEVYVFFFGTELSYDVNLQLDCMDYRAKFLNINSFSQWAERVNLEIVPRNPETYNDWKVGDVIEYKDDKIGNRVIMAKLGEVIIISDGSRKYVYTMSLKNITENYKLVLTDYEQKLLKPQKEKCQFKDGDRVLVREKGERWRFDYFLQYDENFSNPYIGYSDNYDQCIPYNENTWQLLGTTDEYKEKK